MSQPKYTFKQTLQDVTVYAPLEEGTRAKTLDISIERDTLAVRTPNGVLADGKLYAPIAVDESSWSVVDQKELVITLEKTKAEWWPHVLVGDPEIDIKKIQPENSRLSDLDQETRANVEKMMYDQQQQMRGLPTSDEMQKLNQLDKFKKMHPELDFSNLKKENIHFG